MSPHSHSKAAPQLLARVARGRYIFRPPELPMDAALVREYLEPKEVYEKRPPRRRRSDHADHGRESVAESVRMALFAVQRGVCPGCGIYLPHFLRFEAGPHRGIGRRRENGGKEPAVAVLLLQPRQGDERR